MSIRIPFAVTVVGALIVGGATTGTTAARWTDSMGAGSGQVRSAVMAFRGDVSPSSTLTLTKGSATPVTATLTLTDESTTAAKNLVQNLSITGTTAPSGVKLSVQQGACPSSVPTTAASGYTATNITQTDVQTRTRALCVALAADSSAATGTGSVQLSLGGTQVRPGNVALAGGWSYTASGVSIPISVSAVTAPAAPVISCVGASVNGFQWTSVNGLTYQVERRDLSSATYNSDTVGASSPFLPNVTGQSTTFFRIVASNTAGGVSAPSNVLKIVRDGSRYTCGSGS